MTAPNVTPLSQAPSRLAKPSSFTNDSAILLEGLPNFRTQINNLSMYINSINLNFYNFGEVGGVRNMPSSVEMFDYVDDEEQNPILFTSSIDRFLAVLSTHSRNANALSTWFDALVKEHGTLKYDYDKPMIYGVSPAMTRRDNRVVFNQKAQKFSESVRGNINSFHYSMWYSFTTCCATVNCGSVDEEVTLRMNGGDVNDVFIEGKS